MADKWYAVKTNLLLGRTSIKEFKTKKDAEAWVEKDSGKALNKFRDKAGSNLIKYELFRHANVLTLSESTSASDDIDDIIWSVCRGLK